MVEPLRVMMHPVDLANPYIPQLVGGLRAGGVEVVPVDARAMKGGTADVLHLHWPEGMASRSTLLASLKGLGRLLSWLLIAWRTKTAVVWTVHNSRGHDAPYPWLDRLARSAVARTASAWVSLTEAGVRPVIEANPVLRKVRNAVIPHGHYVDAYPRVPDRTEARSSLGYTDSNVVVLYFGALRPYKNVESLVRAFIEVPDPTWRLVVAGRPEGTIGRTLREVATGDDRVDFRLSFIADEDVPALFGAADFVVLPFAELLNSGSAILAISMGCPVLVPDRPALRELAKSVGSDSVLLYEGDLGTQDLQSMWQHVASQDAAWKPDLASLAWPGICEQTICIYESVRSSRDAPSR